MGFEFPIERGKIREFSKATKATRSDYEGERAVIPPTFLATSVLWEPDDADFLSATGFDLSRVLHAGTEYVFHGELPRAGDVLTVSSHIADRYEKDGKRGGTMKFAILATEFRDASGVLVAEQLATIIETEQAPEAQK